MRSWLQAARDGDVEALQLLASCGANADAPDYNGRTALHMAAAEGRKLSIYCLLSRCADPLYCVPTYGIICTALQGDVLPSARGRSSTMVADYKSASPRHASDKWAQAVLFLQLTWVFSHASMFFIFPLVCSA